MKVNGTLVTITHSELLTGRYHFTPHTLSQEHTTDGERREEVKGEGGRQEVCDND